MLFSITLNDLARKYATQQVPAPDGGEDAPRIVQARNRYAFNYKVTAFNLASAVLITSVVLAIFVSFKLFFLIGCGALLARRSFMKDLVLDNREPNNDRYKEVLEAQFGVREDEGEKWRSYNPVEAQIFGYHLWMNTVGVLDAAPAQANQAQANQVAQN